MLAFALAALAAQNINPAPPPPGYAEIRQMAVPVVTGDITDRPYRVIGIINTNVRKFLVIEKDPSDQRVFKELWERASKLGADAVVNAKMSDTLFGGLTWGRRKASGQAIKFLTDAEIARYQPASSAIRTIRTMATGEAPGTINTGRVKLVPANTLSGYCIKAEPGYIGTGAANAPSITTARPLCN